MHKNIDINSMKNNAFKIVHVTHSVDKSINQEQQQKLT